MSPLESTAATEAPPTRSVEKLESALAPRPAPTGRTSTPCLAKSAASRLKALLPLGRPPISTALSGTKTAVPAAGWRVRATVRLRATTNLSSAPVRRLHAPGVTAVRVLGRIGSGRVERRCGERAGSQGERRDGVLGLDRCHVVDRRRQAETVGREHVAVRGGADQRRRWAGGRRRRRRTPGCRSCPRPDRPRRRRSGR